MSSNATTVPFFFLYFLLSLHASVLFDHHQAMYTIVTKIITVKSGYVVLPLLYLAMRYTLCPSLFGQIGRQIFTS
jgi:hypothetical protein